MEKVIIFAFGAVVGGTAAYLYAKNKYQAEKEEEIESMREFFESDRERKRDDVKEEDNRPRYRMTEDLNRAKANYRQLTKDYFESPDPEEQFVRDWLNKPGIIDEPPSEGNIEPPYVITGDSFANEKRNFDKVTLMYYEGNGVLTDQTESVTEDIDELIGRDSLNHFGESEEGALFVRNEQRGVDYEVLLVKETYKPPYPVEDDIY